MITIFLQQFDFGSLYLCSVDVVISSTFHYVKVRRSVFVRKCINPTNIETNYLLVPIFCLEVPKGYFYSTYQDIT